MVDWKIYIDSPQKRALDLCRGSLDKGDGQGVGVCRGDGYSYGDGCGGGYGYSYGDGYGGGYDDGDGDGWSENKW